MSENSTIGWTNSTWPIVAGCEYESPGCSNCWAVRDSWRLAHNPHAKVREAFADTVKKTEAGALVWTGVVRPLWERLDWPLRWRRNRLIFVCSQSDLFHPKVPFPFIAATFGVMAMAENHTFQVLTKHPRRMREFFAWLAAQQGGALETCLWHARKAIGPELANRFDPYPDKLPAWPLENVWLGVTVEDQRRADERIPELLQCPAAVRWLSVEPMLERIALRQPWVDWLEGWYTDRDHHTGDPVQVQMEHIDWIVCGGESAQTRATTRPFDIAWARDLLEQCRTAGVPFFMKQLGTKPLPPVEPGTVMRLGLPLPTGKTSRYKWHEPQHWPEDLRVQEFPR
jgi:protein gp37